MTAAKNVLVLTIGGDCPGLNGIIRGLVLGSQGEKLRIVGGEYGFESVLEGHAPRALAVDEVWDSLPRPGTILGASNQCDPYRWKGKDHHLELLAHFKEWHIDGLVSIGGEGTLHIIRRLVAAGLRCLFIPKTIDNDLPLGGDAIGFWSAVNKAVENIDALRYSGDSHRRVMVVEVMGRSCGHLALASGVAGGVDAILLPEIAFKLDALVTHLEAKRPHPASHLIVVAEGADPEQKILPELERLFKGTSHSVRHTRLGYTQRGAPPRAWDRLYGSMFGAYAIELILANKWNRFITHSGREIIDLDLEKQGEPSYEVGCVSAIHPIVRYARRLGILFGDE